MNAAPQKKVFTPEIKAGLFIATGLVMLMAMILMLGGGEAFFNKHYVVKARFDDVSGLSKGSYVRSGGISVGRVTDISFDSNYKGILITMLVKEDFRQRIRRDSKVQMLTQGVLGDKYVEILDGSSDSPAAENGDILETKGPEGLTEMLKGGENVVKLMEQNLINLKQITESFSKDKRSEKFFSNITEATRNLNETLENLNKGKGAKELDQTLHNLRVMTDRINNGEGTVGALLNDTSLYEDLKNLIGGASRNTVLKFFVKQAVKTSDNENQKREQKEQQSLRKKESMKKDPASTSEPEAVR